MRLFFIIPAYINLAHCRFLVFLLLCLSAGVKGSFASSWSNSLDKFFLTACSSLVFPLKLFFWLLLIIYTSMILVCHVMSLVCIFDKYYGIIEACFSSNIKHKLCVSSGFVILETPKPIIGISDPLLKRFIF